MVYPMIPRAAVASIIRVEGASSRVDQDLVAVEAPLTVELHASGVVRSLGVFMRTPGDDEDFVRGLLYSDGIIRRREDIVSVILGPANDEAGATIARVELAPHVGDGPVTNDRASPATSACGLCGRLVIDGLDHLAHHALPGAGPTLPAATVVSLPDL